VTITPPSTSGRQKTPWWLLQKWLREIKLDGLPFDPRNRTQEAKAVHGNWSSSFISQSGKLLSDEARIGNDLEDRSFLACLLEAINIAPDLSS
jgi:hypothetical protein